MRKSKKSQIVHESCFRANSDSTRSVCSKPRLADSKKTKKNANDRRKTQTKIDGKRGAEKWENGYQKASKKTSKIIIVLLRFSILCQSRLLAALLAPFGSPLAPLGSQRGPKGSQRAPKGSRKGPKGSQRAPKGSRRAPKGSQRARKGSQGDLKGSLAPFWHPFGNTFSIFVAFRGFSLNCDSKRKVFWILGPPRYRFSTTMFFASDFAEHPHMTVGTSDAPLKYIL